MTPTSNLVIRAPSVEFTVDRSTGEAYVSLRKAASILGVPHTTLQYYLDNVLSRTIKADTEQGLSSEMFAFSVQYFSLDARDLDSRRASPFL